MIVPALLLLAGAKGSAPKIYEPKAGSPERKALMDALRKAVTPRVKQPVVFKIDWIRSNGAAAFFAGKPQRPDGRPLDYKGTIYAEVMREGMFDDGFTALMRKRRGKWVPDEWQIGATDVQWDGMWTRKGLPRGLFPPMGGR